MKKTTIILILLLLPLLPVMAQPANPGNPVPIDGGLALLAVAGLTYAASRLRKNGEMQKRESKEKPKEE